MAAKAVAVPTVDTADDPHDPHAERRALNNGFGDALAQAFEFAVTTILFALFGLWLDSRLGTGPLWVVVLSVLGITGVCVKTIYRYKAKIEKEEEGKPWTRRQR
jgi:F0F1-type ATP synthase assembly protein I